MAPSTLLSTVKRTRNLCDMARPTTHLAAASSYEHALRKKKDGVAEYRRGLFALVHLCLQTVSTEDESTMRLCLIYVCSFQRFFSFAGLLAEVLSDGDTMAGRRC